jgi:thiamine biosynthesis lipoprotein
MVSKKFKLFGSEVEFFIESEDNNFIIDELLDEAYALSLKLQKIFNLYDLESELSLLNKKRHIKASPELLEVTSSALKLCELSNGEYDISLGKQFLQRKSKQPVNQAKCSYKDIKLKGNNISLLNNDAWVDLGSIAKGYVADKISSFFLEHGIVSGYIDARGDLKVFGNARIVGIQHPRKKGIIQSITVQNKGVATSGDYNQYDQEYAKSHILNQKDIISATVISDDLMQADAYATMLMVCSSKAREKIIKESGFPAMTVDKNLKKTYYNGFEGLLHNEA